MQLPPFAHLHLHTEHSPLDGACRMDKLMDRVKELNMDSVAITDHGTMSGLLKFQKAAHKASVKPVLGVELYFTEDRAVKDPDNKYYHLTALAETTKGYENLCKITARAYREGMYYKPRADYELLKEHGEGIIILTGCMASRTMQQLMNENNRLPDHQRIPEAREEVLRMMECVGEENVYLEVQNVGIKFDNGMSQVQWNSELAQIARDLKRPLVATGDVHYLLAEDADPHDAMLCVQMKSTLSTPNRMSLLPNRYYLRSIEEMMKCLEAHPESLATTQEIADRCNATIEVDRTFELLPTFPVPEDFRPEGNLPETPAKKNPEKWPTEWRNHQYLKEQVLRGMHKRYGSPLPAEVVERMEFELKTVMNMGVTDYFLIVWDLLRESHERGVPTGPGRGSGAGSILLYALDVTQLDPLAHGLLFERFLNPDRISMPDVDLDFGPSRRGEMMDYMRDKYGDENVSQIITFSRMGSKAAIRAAARAMGPEHLRLADKLAKAIPTKGTVAAPLETALEESPEFRGLINADRTAQHIIKLARWMEGMVSAESVHAAALIVAPKPVHEIVPVQTDKHGKPVSAFDMKDAEGVGLLKLDFLGLRNLEVIAETQRLIRKKHQDEFEAWEVPLDDKPTFDMLARGDSVGVFQFESTGMQDSLRTVGADQFTDLVAIVALYRPGPMANIPVYGARKQGREETKYLHPKLEAIQGETWGLTVYQEQSMLIARELAGFTPGEADTLRKAIGKKMFDLMMQLKPKFIQGCEKNGVPRKVAEALWADNEAAAEYSFNKSHAAAYALVSYVTAFLKANYPTEYMAALLTSIMTTKDKVPFYMYETKRMGIKVLPPDVNESFGDFEPTDEGAIRFGLTAVKGVGHGIVEEIVKERERGGKFKNLWDYCQRVEKATRREIEALIKAGAFDSTGDPRMGLLEVVDSALKQAKNIRKKKMEGQDSLFDALGSAEEEFAAMELMDVPQVPKHEFSEEERFALEREVTGLYVSGHPLDHAHDAWMRVRHVGLGQLSEEHIDRTLTLAGIVTGRRVIYTKRDNKKMLIITLEDLTGAGEIVVFPKTLEQYDNVDRLLEEGKMVALRVKVEEDDRGFGRSDEDDDSQKQIRMSLVLAFPFDPNAIEVSEYFDIQIPKNQFSKELVGRIKGVLPNFPGTKPVRLQLIEEGEVVKSGILPDIKVEPSEKLTQAIKDASGSQLVET